jgi:transposase
MSSTKKIRRHYTTEQKVAIFKRHMIDKVPVSDLCNELELQPSVFYQWQRQVFENLAGAFGMPATERPRAATATLRSLRSTPPTRSLSERARDGRLATSRVSFADRACERARLPSRVLRLVSGARQPDWIHRTARNGSSPDRRLC